MLRWTAAIAVIYKQTLWNGTFVKEGGIFLRDCGTVTKLNVLFIVCIIYV